VQDLELESVDINNAFLNGVLEIPVYMKQPEGFAVGGPDTVCQLHKTLYGLRQAPKEWFEVLSDGLRRLGFEPSDADQALWVVRGQDGPKVYILHYVDDLIMACCAMARLAAVKRKILAVFKGRDLGPADRYINIRIDRDREARTLKISLPMHVKELLTKFRMLDCVPRQIPLSPGADYGARREGEEQLSGSLYAEGVGALMYLASICRPDLAVASGQLARHMAAPTERHWAQLKGVLRYLALTPNHGIVYGAGGATELQGYTDSDYAACTDTRKSRGAYVFMLHGGAVAWSSKRQTVVATSTTEAEYIAAAEAAREATWLRRMVHQLGVPLQGPLPLLVRQRSAWVSTQRTPRMLSTSM
jgi:hypothetical protein